MSMVFLAPEAAQPSLLLCYAKLPHHTSRITKCSFKSRGDLSHTFIAACQPKCCQRPYYAKYILRENCRDLALSGVWTVDGKSRPRCSHYLLFFRARELPKYCLCYGGRWLYRERVHEHARGRGHPVEFYSPRLSDYVCRSPRINHYWLEV